MRSNVKYKLGWVIAAIISFTLTACDNPFQFSLYDADTSDSNLNQKNIDAITAKEFSKDTLVIAAFADSHNYYDDLRKAINAINTRNDIDFVIVGGDVTETGLANQYESFIEEAKNLNVPFVAVIGNHDFLSNGATIYQKLFGPVNFYFDYAGYRFVGFNDNVWENNNTPPDFTWLNTALQNGNRKSIVIAHIQPWTDAQLGDSYSQTYQDVVETNKVILSMGGHSHGFEHVMRNGINYLISGSVSTGGITIIKIFDEGTVKIDRMTF